MSNPKTNKPAGALMDIVQKAMIAFLQADKNGDRVLNFDEFKEVLPKDMKVTEEQAREIFNMCDADGNGTISQDEFFFWTVQVATQYGGNQISGLQEQFKKFDTSGDGQLNSLEFRNAVEPFGFGAVAHDMFLELDLDGTGTVSYTELMQTLKSRRVSVTSGVKKLMTSMSFDLMRREMQDSRQFDSTPWNAQSSDEVRQVCCDRIFAISAKPFDLWKVMLEKGGAAKQKKVGKKQFSKALHAALGFEAGQDELASTCFDEMDEMQSGQVSFDHFLNWINARHRKKVMVKTLKLQYNRDPSDPPLESIVWTWEVLRCEFQKMLMRAGASPLDILLSYDQSADGSLSRKEFLVMIKKVVNDEKLWDESHVKETATDLYESISGGDNQMDIEELERWLSTGWLQLKRSLVGSSPVAGQSTNVPPSQAQRDSSRSPSPPASQHFEMPLPSFGASKSMSSLLRPSSPSAAAAAPIPSRLDDKQRAVAEARRLRAAAEQATKEAQKAQARLMRLIEVAGYAEQAAQAAELTVMQFRERAGASLRTQDSRHRMIQDRQRRETKQPNKFFNTALSNEIAQQGGTRPRLVPSTRPGTASSAKSLHSLRSSSSRPASANSMHVQNPIVIMSGPMVGIPGGKAGSIGVPYWA